MCDDKKKDIHHEDINALSPDAKPTGETKHTSFKVGEVSYQWFTVLGNYKPSTGINLKRLVCGEEAFAAIHEAIANAQSTVEILIWGFDPMMRFNPNKSNETIGELLERKGKEGVQCRIMVWYDNVAKRLEPTLIGDPTTSNYYISDDEEKQQTKEVVNNQHTHNQLLQERDYLTHQNNTLKQQSVISAKDQKTITQQEQQIAELDAKIATIEKNKLNGYTATMSTGKSNGPKQNPQDAKKASEWMNRILNGQIPNVKFKLRNFSSATANNIFSTVNANIAETHTQFKMNTLFRVAPSHHQKLVLIDYEHPTSTTCTAFVMGHNMHRAYWDTKAHYFYDENANRVQGFGPWQDISIQVWGEILCDINDNFLTAWGLIEGPPDNIKERRAHLTKRDFPAKGSKQVLFCRTMPEVQNELTGSYERSILASYKKAIKNSYNYIYMENQYFRYQDIAVQVRKQAEKIQDETQQHGKDAPPLYLFVLTNTLGSSLYSSTTYAMFKELGQQQLLPEAQRTLYEQELSKKAETERLAKHPYSSEIPDYSIDQEISKKDQEHIEPVKTKEDVADMSKEGKGWDIEGKNGKKPFELEDVDGLKIIVGTLTSDSSIKYTGNMYTQGLPEGVSEHRTDYIRYRNIYIHTKLLVVDDLYTFLGSANINTRSFWVDSESGISIPDPEFAHGMRNELWLMHTKQSINGGEQTASAAINCNPKLNYNWWNKKMDNNWKLKAKGEPLECHLTRFWDAEMPYALALD